MRFEVSREYHLSIFLFCLAKECQDSEAAKIITGGPRSHRQGHRQSPPAPPPCPSLCCSGLYLLSAKNGIFSFPPSFHFQPAYCAAIKALSQILLCCKIVGILAEYFYFSTQIKILVRHQTTPPTPPSIHTQSFNPITPNQIFPFSLGFYFPNRSYSDLIFLAWFLVARRKYGGGGLVMREKCQFGKVQVTQLTRREH